MLLHYVCQLIIQVTYEAPQKEKKPRQNKQVERGETDQTSSCFFLGGNKISKAHMAKKSPSCQSTYWPLING